MPGIREGFRERLLSFVRVTTGIALDISANGQVLTRVSGSFIADGLKVGEEVTVFGFLTPANNTTAMVMAVSVTQLTLDKTLVTEASGAPVTVEVRVPSLRKWENRQLSVLATRPWIEEKLVTDPQVRTGIGPNARIKLSGRYELKLVYPPNMGTVPIDAMASGLTLWFHSGIPPLALDNGGFIHLRSASRLGSILEEKTKCSVVVAIVFDSFYINPA